MQISLDQLNNDFIGVADLDGVVDKIEIPHYADMSTMGSTTSPAFSIEFWIRPRRMPADQTPMALFLKSSQASGSISLNLNSDGSLQFSATPKSGTPLICTTDITDHTHKVGVLSFNYIAVTGTVGSSLVIRVNGEIACQKNSWGGITVLPASNDGTLVYGENELDSRKPVRFNGQIKHIQLFNTERTQDEIDRSINSFRSTYAGCVGSWPLTQLNEINIVHYVISNSESVSKLEVLDEFDPPLTGFPVETVVRDQTIDVIRLTREGIVVASAFTLSGDKIIPVSGSQRIMESRQAEKGCFAVAHDRSRNHLILLECFAEDESPGALRFKWNVLEINDRGEKEAINREEARGSLLVKGIGSLDTRLSAKIVDNHLFLTAGTTLSASIFFLDVTLSSDGFPTISLEEMVAQPIGPEVKDSGATYYAYLYKETSTSTKPFLRRMRPQNGHPTSSYTIAVIDTDPDSLVAKSISSDMLDNDWFWFLFKIGTLVGGNAIQSGERINIQTPDSNPRNDESWSYVKYEGERLQADQREELLNFWIFKTQSCNPENGGYSVVAGEIGPDNCILLWPKIEGFEPGKYQHILAHPTEEEIQQAKERFGSWFGPWRLRIPTETSPERPIPLPADTPPDSPLPRNVYQGNKYSLHFGDGISVETPLEESGLRGGLLQFAKTTVAPVMVSNNDRPASVKLLFRGNGGPLPLLAFPHDEKAKLEAFSTVYQEGSYAQRKMTSGLFYSIEYTPPPDSSSQGKFKNLIRIGGLESLEYPDPPTLFVWLIPPPFKVTGMCEAISTMLQFNDDTVNNIAPNSVVSLTNVINKAVGPGSFGEGMFKPFLSVHFDLNLLDEISSQVGESLKRKIDDCTPKPPPASPISRPSIGTHSWRELGYLKACVTLSNLTFWADKVQKQKIKDKLKAVLQSKWMTEQMYQIRLKEASNSRLLHDASTKYSAYGGIAVLLANRLTSPQFLEELLTKDELNIRTILDSHLKVIDLIRPDLGIEVRQDIMSALLAKGILMQVCSPSFYASDKILGQRINK